MRNAHDARDELKVSFIDVLGREHTLFDGLATSGPVRIPMPELASGVYFVLVRDDSHTVTVPIVIRR